MADFHHIDDPGFYRLGSAGPGEVHGPHLAGPEGFLSVEVFSTLGGQVANMEQNPDREDAILLKKGMAVLAQRVAAGNPAPTGYSS